jgi:type II secretory pathway pseudopilin PulG
MERHRHPAAGPRAQAARTAAFTLVELLVVIGIIASSWACCCPRSTRPAPRRAPSSARSNLRNVGQGIMIYLAENKGTFPAAYLYEGHEIVQGSPPSQNPSAPEKGYLHWSSYLYGSNGNGKVGAEAFTCPELENGGLPPTNPDPALLDDGQTRDGSCMAGFNDQQAERMAYTVNEALMPRNKFVAASRVRPASTSTCSAAASATAATSSWATEFWSDWRIVSKRPTAAAKNVCKSHRPVTRSWTPAGGGSST